MPISPGISVINLAVGIKAPSYLANGLVALQRVGHSVLSARVLINLREAGTCETETTGVISTHNSYQFRIFAFVQTEIHRDSMQSTVAVHG